MYICRIIAEIEQDYVFLREYVRKYPVELVRTNINDNNIPTLIIGWSVVKRDFPNHNILDETVIENTSWTPSLSEKEEGYQKNIENFISESIKKWLPDNFKLFDPVLDNEAFENFISNELKKDKISYVFFHKKAMYINNDENNFILNLNSFDLIYDDYKSVISSFLSKIKCMCLSYKNISNYVDLDKIGCIYTFENAKWVKFGVEIDESYFKIVPMFDIEKYIPFIMSKVSKFSFTENEKISIKRACERDNITEWLSTRTICVSKGLQRNSINIIQKGENRLIQVPYSNKRTLTGRIVSVGKYNPQNLDKKTKDRENIISRFEGGKIAVYDYMSFEARIALYFCKDKEFIDKFRKKDMHLHTAQIIFGNKPFTLENREFAKNINHRVLYGSSKKAVIEQLSYLKNPEEVYYNVREFLKPLLVRFKESYDEFKNNGYIINPWGTIIRPEKDYASFNNFIQSSATEIMVDQLYKIKNFLFNYESEFLFQVHDSLIFDISPKEAFIVKDLAKLIMCYKDMFFNISYSSGYDYKNLSTPIELTKLKCEN